MDQKKNLMKGSKIPEIKQTKTSQLRFKKANPLPDLQRTFSHLLSQNTMKISKVNKSVAVERKPQRNFIKENAAAVRKYKKPTKVANVKENPNSAKLLSSKQIRKSFSCENLPLKEIQEVKTPSLKDVRNLTNGEDKPVLFKTTSAFNQGSISLSTSNSNTTMRKSMYISLKTIPTDSKPEDTPIIFKTPSAYNRRSITVSTPNTNPTMRKSMQMPLKTTPTESELQERLNKWLKVHGKSMSSYCHLKCFGLHVNTLDIIDEDNKENIEVEECLSSSYDDLSIDTKQSENNPSNKDIAVALKEVLEDLHNLILDGYPRDHCEIWLQMIKAKFSNVEQESQYWECRAALEEARGCIEQALECYKSAIIQGAPIKDIDESLDNLLKKFSLLDLSTSKYTPKLQESQKGRNKIILEARNVFKSSIIKFAIQEKNLKKNKINLEVDKIVLLATPVRRSTRISRTSYVHTPGMRICSSLKTERNEENFVFQNNPALL